MVMGKAKKIGMKMTTCDEMGNNKYMYMRRGITNNKCMHVDIG